MEFIDVRIKNWARYQSKNQRSKMSFFRVEASVFNDSKIAQLSPSGKLLWIYLLCESTTQFVQTKDKLNTGKALINIRVATSILSIRGTTIRAQIKLMEELQMVTATYKTKKAVQSKSENKNKSESEKKRRKKNRESQKDDPALEKFSLTEIVEAWNTALDQTQITKIKSIDGTRRKTFLARCKEYKTDINFWKALFHTIEKSDFLSGRKKDWSASFDWIIRPTNLTKILEGNYQNRVQTSNAPGAERGKKMTQKEFLGPFYNEAIHGDPDRVVIE